ncbi:MAG: hypothetical protein K9G13_06505 [Aquiluna sp.]|nr:hypothetical protein [Aquiluna sp.]MCF8546168.1 hypothetical protein [Aquiluna sp.]
MRSGGALRQLVGHGGFVRWLLSQIPDEFITNESAKRALQDFDLGFEGQGCSFSIVNPGGDNETYIVVAAGSSADASGHSDETLATVVYTIQSELERWDQESFKDNSDENSRLVRWFRQDLQFISEKEPDEPWEPYKFHTEKWHDLRPFTKFEIESSPYFGSWNQIYIRLYHEDPLDSSYGTNSSQYIDLLEYRSNFERVNFSKISPSDYLDRLVGQFDESPLSRTLEHWYEIPGFFGPN